VTVGAERRRLESPARKSDVPKAAAASKARRLAIRQGYGQGRRTGAVIAPRLQLLYRWSAEILGRPELLELATTAARPTRGR
jgi:hypothetical protein